MPPKPKGGAKVIPIPETKGTSTLQLAHPTC
jgi:hypothetical protein